MMDNNFYTVGLLGAVAGIILYLLCLGVGCIVFSKGGWF
jgi:hypothetical protein